MPSTLTWCAVVGRELAAGREQRGEVEDEVDLELGEDALEQVAVEDRADELAAAPARASGGSSGLTSSVMIGGGRPSRAASIRPWPISPLAPVMSTTGLRSMLSLLCAPRRAPQSILDSFDSSPGRA